jgi:[ribosomal protein S5]-alanine N-acetyltransferase
MTASLHVETPRLLLVAWPAELLEDVSPLGATKPEGWPDEELQGLLDLYAGWLRDDPGVLGWGPWIAIDRAANAIVGGAGFVGKPRDGQVELGYGIAPEAQRRGYATEAAGGVVAWAQRQHGVERVVAGCDADNAASIRVLEKLGFERAGTADGQLRWVLAAPPA